MSQFDVFANSGRGANEYPYLLDVQSELISKHLPTRILVPCVPRDSIKNIVFRLHVVVRIENKDYIALFDQLASVECHKLEKPLVNLAGLHAEKFKTALDVLFFNYP